MGSFVINDDEYLSVQRSVTKLHFGSIEEKKQSAMAVEKLARESISAKAMMVNLGAIPPLVSMMDSSPNLLPAAKALIAIVNHSHTNKDLLLEAGFLHILPRDTNHMEEQERKKVSELVLQLSSFARTRNPICSDKVLTFVGSVLDSPTATVESKIACLLVLRQLSAGVGSRLAIASEGVVRSLLRLVLVKELSGAAMKILGRLMGISHVVKIMEKSASVPADFVETMKWKAHRSCQESSAHILMMLGERSRVLRRRMMKIDIVPVLLEVALFGTPLAHKSAMGMMKWFQEETGYCNEQETKRISSSIKFQRLMKDLVRQSLENNLKSISLRAAAAESSTKSL